MTRHYLRAGGDDRRFAPGFQARISGVAFRVEQGRKDAEDRKLVWLTERGWVPVDMAAGFLLADFFYENEHVLYPPPKDGGERYIDFLLYSVQHGWEASSRRLNAEKEAARLRRVEGRRSEAS